MTESIKNLLGISDKKDITKMSGNKILKAAIKSGKISRKVIVEFNGHPITEEDIRSIVNGLVNETNTDVMIEFISLLKETINDPCNIHEHYRKNKKTNKENISTNTGIKTNKKQSKKTT